MVELKTPHDVAKAAPYREGKVSLSVLPGALLHWIAPWPGARAAMSDALEAAHGFGFPGPGAVFRLGEVHCIWAGRDAAFLLGPQPAQVLAAHGAVADVSDGWVRFNLEGDGVSDVLARLCPVDLRAHRFAGPTALRTVLRHIGVLIIAEGAKTEIWVMRSFAASAWGEITQAMTAVAARQALRP